jgi:hypothetical protein
MTLNLLRGSRINPKLSAYAQLHGAFDYNKTPLAPPGTKVVIHEKPSIRQLHAPHGVDGYYVGPAMKHFRCYRVYATDMGAERIANTEAWFPLQVIMPIPVTLLSVRSTRIFQSNATIITTRVATTDRSNNSNNQRSCLFERVAVAPKRMARRLIATILQFGFSRALNSRTPQAANTQPDTSPTR